MSDQLPKDRNTLENKRFIAAGAQVAQAFVLLDRNGGEPLIEVAQALREIVVELRRTNKLLELHTKNEVTAEDVG